MKKKFIEEFNEHTNSKFSLEYKKCLYSGKSKFQKIEVFDTIGFGKTLLLDSCFMVTEKDHHLYHNKCKEKNLKQEPNMGRKQRAFPTFKKKSGHNSGCC